MSKHNRSRKAFTLVELLVVMTIIGVLVGLLMPAVQVARETARKGACSSNMHNLGLALQQYEASNNIFSLNWGSTAGSYNTTNPLGHSWITMILPNLDKMQLFQQIKMGQPLNFSSSGLTPNTTAASTPIPVLTCPSDLYDQSPGMSSAQYFMSTSSSVNANPLAVTNYKGCLGMNMGGTLNYGGGEKLIGQKGRNSGTAHTGMDYSNGVFCRNGSSSRNAHTITGVTTYYTYGPLFPTTTAQSDIVDGASTTIMVGESVAAWSAFSSWYSWDAPLAWAAYPINYDGTNTKGTGGGRAEYTRRGYYNNTTIARGFFSRHAGGCNMLFADEHVAWTAEGTDYHILWAMSTIDGREVVEQMY